MADDTTVTVTVEAPDGSDEVVLPSGLMAMLAEDGESNAEVVGDLALFSCAQRIHATVHHAEGEPSDELRAIEAQTMELFEDRFEMTYGEATGHSH